MSDTYKILAINPGSTTTKIAIYENETEIHRKSLEHPAAELAKYRFASDQSDLRKNAVEAFLKECGFDIRQLSAIVARGGALPPVRLGAYQINEAMVNFLKFRPLADHAANTASIIAFEMAGQLHIPAYIYDVDVCDHITDIAKISGLSCIERRPYVHVLNSRAMGFKFAASQNRKYSDLTLIIAHIGGGATVSLHNKGHIDDAVGEDEGPFSPERSGRLPSVPLIELCYSGNYDKRTAVSLARGKGGILSYLGTNSALDVEKQIAEGDMKAELIYNAMAYQVSKGIGELATVVQGRVDAIIITGGIANSKTITRWIADSVAFIAPVTIMPGENEMEALAIGALRVLRGEEAARVLDGG